MFNMPIVNMPLLPSQLAVLSCFTWQLEHFTKTHFTGPHTLGITCQVTENYVL